MHMTRLLAKKAPNAPGKLAFHTHQVVSIFHKNMCMYARPNNFFQLDI